MITTLEKPRNMYNMNYDVITDIKNLKDLKVETVIRNN